MGSPDAEILAALLRRGRLLHTLPASPGHNAVARLLADDFWEVSASGTVYNCRDAVEAMTRRGSVDDDSRTLEDARIRRPGPDTWTITAASMRRTREPTAHEMAA